MVGTGGGGFEARLAALRPTVAATVRAHLAASRNVRPLLPQRSVGAATLAVESVRPATPLHIVGSGTRTAASQPAIDALVRLALRVEVQGAAVRQPVELAARLRALAAKAGQREDSMLVWGVDGMPGLVALARQFRVTGPRSADPAVSWESVVDGLDAVRRQLTSEGRARFDLLTPPRFAGSLERTVDRRREVTRLLRGSVVPTTALRSSLLLVPRDLPQLEVVGGRPMTVEIHSIGAGPGEEVARFELGETLLLRRTGTEPVRTLGRLLLLPASTP